MVYPVFYRGLDMWSRVLVIVSREEKNEGKEEEKNLEIAYRLNSASASALIPTIQS